MSIRLIKYVDQQGLELTEEYVLTRQGYTVMHQEEGVDVYVFHELSAEDQTKAHIATIQTFLGSTDYIGARIAEGSISQEESDLIIANRALARARMNELQVELPESVPSVTVEWQPDMVFNKGTIISHNDTLYELFVSTVYTVAGHEPPNVPAVYKLYTEPGTITTWIQPTGAHDSYNTGDRVVHNGHTWVSTTDANTWEPGVYGWEIV